MKRLEPKEIIAESAKDSGVNPEVMYAVLSRMVQTNPNFRVIRSNNSLFTIYNKGNGDADIALDTADSPKTLIHSIKDFIGSMKKAGFKNGFFDMENDKILKAIEMAGGKVSVQSDSSGKKTGVVEF